MAGESFEGWANRETWLVVLWIDNDQGMAEIVRQLVKANVPAAERDAWAWKAGECVKEALGEFWPMAEGGLAGDLLGCSLGRVEWRAVGEHYVAGLIEDGELGDDAEVDE